MEHLGKNVRIRTNSFGLRGKEFPFAKAPGKKRILVLDALYTFGVYCENDAVYLAVLEKMFVQEGRPEIEVLNAGYADGWSTDHHYSCLTNRGIEFNPDIIIYGFFIGNDLVEINSHQWIEIDNHGLPTRIVNPNIQIGEFGRIWSNVKDAKTVAQEFIYSIPLLREGHFSPCCTRSLSIGTPKFPKDWRETKGTVGTVGTAMDGEAPPLN